MNDEAVKWLRDQVTQRMEMARATSRAAWRAWYAEPWYDGEFLNDGRTARADLWGRMGAGTFTGQGALPTVMADHIVLNDPQDVIARCEAELAILDEHDTKGWQVGDPLRDCQWETWPCRTVRLVASGYRHRPGYAEHWGEVTQQSLQQSGT